MKKARWISVFWCFMSGLMITSQIQADKYEETVSKFIKKAEEDSKYVGDNYRHQELEITENLKDGVVIKKEQKTYLVKKRWKLIQKTYFI